MAEGKLLINRESDDSPCFFGGYMEYTAKIYNLSTKFYNDYPTIHYPEILTKSGRPYACLLIEYMDDLFICIPYRSNIRHNYAYLFKNSLRSRLSRSGLDYTKVVLIQNVEYLDDSVHAIVDQDEYRETVQNLPKIAKEAFAYVSDYKDVLNKKKNMHPREWARRYAMSTITYFDKFLIEGNQ